MAGLLDFTPEEMGILGMGAALLNAGGETTTPINMGQALGQGLQGYMGGIKTGQSMEDAKLKRDKEARERLMQESLFKRLGLGSGQSPTATATAAGSQGGLTGMTPEEVAMYRMFGVDLTEPWKVANQGLKQESGAYYTTPGGKRVYVPKVGEGMRFNDDGSVSNVSGYAQALGDQRLAEEAAKAEYQLVEVVGGDGNTYKVPLSTVVGGQAPAQSGVNPVVQQQQIDANQAALQDQNADRQAARQRQNAAHNAGLEMVNVTDASGNQYSIPRSSIGGGYGGGVLTERNPATVARETEAAKKDAADAASYMSTLREAVAKDQGVMKQLDRFGELNRQTATGFGINNPLFSDLWDSNKQQMNAITANLAPRQRPVGAGSTSDADLRLYLTAVPSLSKYGDANKGIREEFRRNLKTHQDKLKYAERYVQRKGSLSGLESAWSAKQEVSGKLKTNATYSRAADAWEAKYGSLDTPNQTTGKDFYSSLYDRINK